MSNLLLKFFANFSKWQYLNISDIRDNGLKYNVWFDSRFGAMRENGLSGFINHIYYILMPKIYIEIDQGKFLPIYRTFKTKRIFTFGKYNKDCNIKNIISGLNKRIELIQIYFANQSYSLITDNAFYYIIEYMNSDISNMDILKMIINEGV